jgi:hypothetical protein
MLIIGTCGLAGYDPVGADRVAGQPSRPNLPSPVIKDDRCMLGCRHTVSRTYGPNAALEPGCPGLAGAGWSVNQ